MLITTCPLGADEAGFGEGSGEEIGVDSGIYTGTAPGVSGVAVPVEDQQVPGFELAGQPSGPLDRGGRVSGGPDDQDRARAHRGERGGDGLGRNRPVIAREGTPG